MGRGGRVVFRFIEGFIINMFGVFGIFVFNIEFYKIDGKFDFSFLFRMLMRL